MIHPLPRGKARYVDPICSEGRVNVDSGEDHSKRRSVCVLAKSWGRSTSHNCIDREDAKSVNSAYL